jgi:hypothetical protein
VNNAALGRLILDGQDEGSLFNFFRTGLTNALYVDLIEFKDAATNFVSGSVAGTLAALEVNLDTNFTIYYGDAIINGGSIAEKLNGGYGLADTNGGRFFWVSNYSTGFFSSTNMSYSDGSGTNRLNRALVTSCDIDSNGNGLPNCMDGNPVPVAPGIMVQPQGQNVNQGGSAVFTVVATGSPQPTYQWRLNGANIGGATNSSYTRGNVQMGDVGSYSAVIRNISGTAISKNALLSVPPVLNVVFTNNPTRSVVLSWNTMPLTSNYLYSASSLPTTNWQLVTNFVSSATIGSRTTLTYPIGTNRAIHYRVRVQSP